MVEKTSLSLSDTRRNTLIPTSSKVFLRKRFRLTTMSWSLRCMSNIRILRQDAKVTPIRYSKILQAQELFVLTRTLRPQLRL